MAGNASANQINSIVGFIRMRTVLACLVMTLGLTGCINIDATLPTVPVVVLVPPPYVCPSSSVPPC
jgi:hypothetical protein